MSDDTLVKSVQGLADRLGIPIKMTPDLNRADYERGSPLTLGELRALPADAIVWVWAKEHGEETPRVDGPFRIRKAPGEGYEYWGLDDGSSFGLEFTHSGSDSPEATCYDDWGGEGEMFLFHAAKNEPLKWVPVTAEIRKSGRQVFGDLPRSWKWVVFIRDIPVFRNMREVSMWLPREQCWMSVRPKKGGSLDDAARLLVKRR